VVSASDSEALFLARKTNLMRDDMDAREQGKVLSKMITTFEFNINQLAKKIGKNFEWVNRRIILAMNLNNEVAKALSDKKINQSVAEVIGTLDNSSQTNFLLYILENKITTREDAYRAKKRFLNNTIYTIGYEGRDLQTFIQILKYNGITRTCTTASSVQVLRLPSDSVSCFNLSFLFA